MKSLAASKIERFPLRKKLFSHNNSSSSKWKWAALILLAVLAIGYGVLSHFMGGPRDVYGFLRYALPQWHRGDLHVGDRAPDVPLMSLNGQTQFHLSDRIGQRPLVLIFGSYT
ncbi:MAG: hypothetical protein WCD49_09800 [Candidatus Acidiferrales bacterium]